MNEPLNFQIVGRLLDYIREARLPPDALLPPENVLAAELQVSRVILREGLSYLKALGLVSSRRGSGYRVCAGSVAATLSTVLHALARGGMTQVTELYDLRRILEIGAIADAVDAAEPADHAEVRAAMTELEEITEIADDAALARFSLAELRFHRALLKPARCQALEIINQALADFFGYRFKRNCTVVRLSAEAVRRTNLAHRALADAFEVGNAAAAMLLLRDHLHSLPRDGKTISDISDNKPTSGRPA